MAEYGLSGAPVPKAFPFATDFNELGQQYDLPPCLLAAIAKRETLQVLDPATAIKWVSADGGHGLMQLTSSYPATWADPFDNIQYAITTFILPAWHYWIAHGATGEALVRLVAASYNEGLGAAIKYHAEGNVDLGTTEDYAAGVLANYLAMCDNSHEVPAITITHPVETEVAPTPVVKAKTTNSAAIVPKVASATLGGAVATLVVSLLGYFNINVPTDLTAALTTIFAFVFGYLTPSE